MTVIEQRLSGVGSNHCTTLHTTAAPIIKKYQFDAKVLLW